MKWLKEIGKTYIEKRALANDLFGRRENLLLAINSLDKKYARSISEKEKDELINMHREAKKEFKMELIKKESLPSPLREKVISEIESIQVNSIGDCIKLLQYMLKITNERIRLYGSNTKIMYSSLPGMNLNLLEVMATVITVLIVMLIGSYI
ncbi:hypothetical protein [Bacillus toyonensis]|uniref:hypothetical protein n=1 Tax=Bacillus toyonensis TaxID=155322 RepID=UPI00027BE99E|nr:hypothetical protein [Bacillus toyonensis]EJV41916.1 hypothetical protein IEA_05544 [Bacillus toyonensis]EJV89905.1 hypothetical protein IGI_05549 [Bacillus toyonensis]EOP32035.1 hypothetical protein IG5_05698 [Bacillus toyonensis]MBE7138669.1 hypothetical protein [Bacillus toyonensis]MBE7166992.1 hypothetical protein [Bacillus toyonensis]